MNKVKIKINIKIKKQKQKIKNSTRNLKKFLEISWKFLFNKVKLDKCFRIFLLFTATSTMVS